MAWGGFGWLTIVAIIATILVFAVVIGAIRTARRPPAGHPDAGSGTTAQQRGAFERALDNELERARRHERPLTLVRVGPEDGLRGVPGAGTTPLTNVPVRRTDHVFDLGGSSYIIAPETDAVAAKGLVQRFASTGPRDPADQLRAACFPLDGVTSGALLARLHDETPPRASDPKPRIA